MPDVSRVVYDAALTRVQAAVGECGPPCEGKYATPSWCHCMMVTLAALGLDEPPTEDDSMILSPETRERCIGLIVDQLPDCRRQSEDDNQYCNPPRTRALTDSEERDIVSDIIDVILSAVVPPTVELTEAQWRRRVMGEARDALACGDGEAAYNALTRHEREGYPWAPGAPSDRGPDEARGAVPPTETPKACPTCGGWGSVPHKDAVPTIAKDSPPCGDCNGSGIDGGTPA